MKRLFLTILKLSAKRFRSVLTLIESDNCVINTIYINVYISRTNYDRDLNLRQMKEKNKALITNYQFVTFDPLTLFISDFTFCANQYTV